MADSDIYCPNCGAQLVKTGPNAAGSNRPSWSDTPGGSRSGIDALINKPDAQNYWFRRLLAIIIDFIIVAIVIGVIFLVLTISSIIVGTLVGGPITGFFGFLTFPFIVGIFLILYSAFSEATHGTTFGKSAMRLRVTSVNGGRPNLGQAFVRNVSKIYWLLLLLDVTIGLAIEADYKLKVSDKWAGTIVVLQR